MRQPNLLEHSRLLDYLDDLIQDTKNFKNVWNKQVSGVSGGKMYDVILKTITEEVKKGESQWLKELKPKLNTRVPTKYKNKKRPQGRMFPYRVPVSQHSDKRMANAGDLVNSISTDFTTMYQNGQIRIKAWTEIKSFHGLLTNYGITRAGRGTSKGQWVGWLPKVLHSKTPYGNSKYGYVTSFDSIIKGIFRSKRLYNRLYYLKKKLRDSFEAKGR